MAGHPLIFYLSIHKDEGGAVIDKLRDKSIWLINITFDYYTWMYYLIGMFTN